MTINAIHNQYKKKSTHPREVISESLKKIHKHEKRLNAFVTINENALNDVKLLPAFDPVKYPLWGIPISIKDNFCTKGLRTTASSKVLDSFIPPYDATVVTRLRHAGAIIIGKTNMDAWAHGSSTETSDYGPTRNPHNTDYMPGGSSGGAAASVAAGIVPLAIGSETAGSIRLPAGWCGVIGFKPTYGRVSRYGLIAMASSTDCPGPIARNVDDITTALRVLSGHDPYDATTLRDELTLSKGGEKPMHIGWSKTYLHGATSETKDAFFAMLKKLASLGHSTHEIELIDPQYSIAVYTIVQRAEVASNLARFDGIRFGNSRKHFGFEAKKRIMLGNYVLSVGYFDAYYIKAQKVRTKIIDDFHSAFRLIDAIVAPISPTPALKIGESKNYPYFGELMDVLVEPSSIAGLPAIAVPIGFTQEKLPISMQIISPWKQEQRLLSLAHQLDRMYQFETSFTPHGF